MVELSVSDDYLHIKLLGWSRLLGFKGRLDIPLTAIKSVSSATGLPKLRWTDLRLLGTAIPGVMAVGRYCIGSPHRWAFLDVNRWSREVLRLEMDGFSYSILIVEVNNGQDAIRLIQDNCPESIR